jgi:hypothetical protein
MGEKLGEMIAEKIRNKIGWEEERCEGERKITPRIAVSMSVGVIVNK